MSKYLWRESRSGLWQVDAQWADRLLPVRARGGRSAGDSSDGLDGGAAAAATATTEFPLIAALREAELVKGGRGRRTVRITVGGTVLYAKQYEASWRARRMIRREWLTARWAREQGLPVARPVAACWKAGRPTLVTEDAGSQTLSQIIQQHYYPASDDEPPYPGDRPPELISLYRRRAGNVPQGVPGPAEIAALLADLLVRLDRLGLRHRDLHPGNIVLSSADDETADGGRVAGVKSGDGLVLLDLLDLETMPGPGSLHDHLVQLNHYFEPLAGRGERYRLLHLLEQAGLPLRHLAGRLERDTWRYHRRQWRSRDERANRQSKYYQRIRGANLRGMAASDVAAELNLADGASAGEEVWAGLNISELVKDSRRGRSGFGRLGERRVFIKRDSERGWRQPGRPWPSIVEAWLRGTRQKRAWQKANSLLVRGVGTARPLLWLDRQHGLAGCESVLASEALEDGWQSLDAALPAASGGSHLALVEAVARTIRRLHESGLSHRDLKAQNLLVRRDVGRPANVAGADVAARLAGDRPQVAR